MQAAALRHSEGRRLVHQPCECFLPEALSREVGSDSIFIQVSNRKAQTVIVPYKVTVFAAKTAELVGVEIGAHLRVLAAAEKRLEIDYLLRPVAKRHAEVVIAWLFN